MDKARASRQSGIAQTPTNQGGSHVRTRCVLRLLSQPPTAQRVAALKRIIPPAVVQQVLRQSGRGDRHCPRLPLWLVVWIVIGLGLFATDSLPMIFKHLQPFLFATPASNTISQARLALGLLVLRLLSHRVVRLLCQPDTPGAFYHGLRSWPWTVSS